MTSDNPPGRDPIAVGAIVEHALDIVVEQGLSELSLRPLAQRAGVSVAVITARIGTKADLLQQVATEAAARDRTFFGKWQALADGADVTRGDERAALAGLAFQEWVGHGSRQAFLLIELVHECALRPQAFPTLEAWLTDAGRFWSGLIFGTAALSDVALGYIIDEAGFALAAKDNPAYQLLRVLCLRRLAQGILPTQPGESGHGAVERLIERLEPAVQPDRARDDSKRRHIAASAAQIIVSQGIGAVTHRSVALAAGVPASTVVYHFGAQPALVAAGLQAIIERFRQSLAATRDRDHASAGAATVRDLVKATSLIALAAAREPGLVPYALDMRRRRGENITAAGVEQQGLETGGQFDRTAAQVISVALFGMQMVAMARQLPERDASKRGFSGFTAWRLAHAG